MIKVCYNTRVGGLKAIGSLEGLNLFQWNSDLIIHIYQISCGVERLIDATLIKIVITGMIVLENQEMDYAGMLCPNLVKTRALCGFHVMNFIITELRGLVMCQ